MKRKRRQGPNRATRQSETTPPESQIESHAPQSASDSFKQCSDEVTREEFEAALYAQEHRFFYLLYNLFFESRAFSEKDPRRAAIRKALLLRLLTPSSSAITAGGVSLTAILGIYLAYKANELLSRQNDLIQSQNKLVEIQNDLAESQRRSATSNELSAIFNRLDEETSKFDPNRSIAIYELNQRLRDVEAAVPFDSAKWLELRKEKRDKVAVPYTISQSLTNRIISFCHGATPYSVLNDGRVVGPVSPERSVLLISLLRYPVDMYDLFRYADWTNCYLKGQDFERKDFRGARLLNSIFHNVTFLYCDMRNSDFSGCQFVNVAFMSLTDNPLEGAMLPSLEMLDEVTCRNLNPSGAFVRDSKWLDKLVLPKESTFKKDDWTLELKILSEEHGDTPMSGYSGSSGKCAPHGKEVDMLF